MTETLYNWQGATVRIVAVLNAVGGVRIQDIFSGDERNVYTTVLKELS